MGLKTIKMEWDLCSSPPWVPFYPYTMFQNPMPKPSCQKSRKTIITQKVLVTQSSNIVHCDQHTQKPMCADFQALKFECTLFQGMPNPMAQVSSFYVSGSWVNQNFSQKFHILLILTGKMHWNGLSGAYLGFKACQIQWHRFQVSMISGSWKIKISGKNFTFCWFWLGKCIEMAWVVHI